MQTRGKGWPAHALVILAYLLLALALTWPLAAHFGSHVPGNGSDDPPLTWNLWWVSHALLDLKTGPFYCNYLFYPLGINLAFYTYTVLNGLQSIPLQATVGLIPASNLLLLSGENNEPLVIKPTLAPTLFAYSSKSVAFGCNIGSPPPEILTQALCFPHWSAMILNVSPSINGWSL